VASGDSHELRHFPIARRKVVRRFFQEGDTMKFSIKSAAAVTAAFFISAPFPAQAETFFFSTGSPDGRMASASRPGTPSGEIESADDFVTTAPQTSITSATFTGLVPTGSNVQGVTVEIYRVFPNDSNVGRTSGPPTFSTTNVPTRVNSPSDVALDFRSLAGGGLNVTTSNLGSFTAANSVRPGGVNLGTGGTGGVTGNEVIFSVSLTTPFNLAAGHYFFVPQVMLDNGEFLWLSAPRPIGPPGTSFPPGSTDLQSWMRDDGIDPDWLRIGTDIVGGATPPTFNAAFSLTGIETPLPGALPLFATGLGALGLLGWRRKRKATA